MKPKHFLYWLLAANTLCCTILQAQNEAKIDSLRKSLADVHSDSTTITILKNLSWYYATTRSKLDSATFYADSLNRFSSKINHQSGIALSHFYHGLIGRFKGDYSRGLSHLEKYLKFSKDSLNVAAGLFQIGVIQHEMGNYEECLKNYFRILKIYEENGSEKSIATTLHSIGHIQRKMDKQKEAIESYQKSINIKEKLGDNEGIVMSLTSLGNAYGEMEQYNLALIPLIKAYELAHILKVPFLSASVSDNLGSLYGKTEEHSKALKYHLEAYEIRKNLPSNKDLASSLNSIGGSYFKLKEYEKSKNYLERSLAISKNIDAKPITLRNYEVLGKLLSETRNYKGAYYFQKIHSELKDSIFNKEKNKQLVELETKYEVSQKDKDIAILTKENEVQEANAEKEATIRKALIGGLVSFAIIGLLLFYTMRQRLKNQKMIAAKNEQINKAKLAEELQTLEMKALRAQMNPHFLFNSLNSINTMILNDENENASRYLSKFAKLVRMLLENSEQPMVSLKDEMDMLETYIQLEAIRFNNKLEYQINIDTDIEQESTLLPSMVIQPFVENAIWHGLLHKDNKGLLTISITEDDHKLHCSIIDNGVGREKSVTLKQKGGLKKKSMGIKITADRLKLLTKQKIQEVIKIIDLKDENQNAVGTQVNLQIPIA
ncbi:tetratricopeptide repeat protein [Maribacter algarum]|uniref:Tetratricopeptide repeat protein n=1 Tax=Maribacter algarum (ex Zhang et al. 2020) TaxID=2578118 RepID=A0A5S3PQB7_9FLAO|nr:tetratricopeptide repeat protein [Maribacter algarum]TMM56819.1 tetratricopeptide repeat protein [Maribacter algarum]